MSEIEPIIEPPANTTPIRIGGDVMVAIDHWQQDTVPGQRLEIHSRLAQLAGAFWVRRECRAKAFDASMNSGLAMADVAQAAGVPEEQLRREWPELEQILRSYIA
jgi:hypothetical protein